MAQLSDPLFKLFFEHKSSISFDLNNLERFNDLKKKKKKNTKKKHNWEFHSKDT